MHNAVWATFNHVTSTDENPNHGLCKATWCIYKKALDNGILYY